MKIMLGTLFLLLFHHLSGLKLNFMYLNVLIHHKLLQMYLSWSTTFFPSLLNVNISRIQSISQVPLSLSWPFSHSHYLLLDFYPRQQSQTGYLIHVPRISKSEKEKSSKSVENPFSSQFPPKGFGLFGLVSNKHPSS